MFDEQAKSEMFKSILGVIVFNLTDVVEVVGGVVEVPVSVYILAEAQR